MVDAARLANHDETLVDRKPKLPLSEHQLRLEAPPDRLGRKREGKKEVHLAFPHPKTGQPGEIESPVPPDMGGHAHAAGGDGK